MRINDSTVLVGKKLIFVPYKKHHVEKYHTWMQDEELLEKTASEPLSLEEEYEMQHRWWQDDDKCTFILLNKNNFNDDKDALGHPPAEINAMAGDVNLFFNNADNSKEAEVEVMIAEKSMRGQGLGKEAVQTMMYYGLKVLGVETYTVKIGYSNAASIRMFTRLGFVEVGRTDVFEEITYSLDCCSSDFKTNVIAVAEPVLVLKSDYNVQ